MYRQIPVQNKICFMREHERNTYMHETKIRTMKKMIDNTPPPQFGFLVSRKKKEALQQERNIEITRENKIIITKIKSIMRGNSHSLSRLTTTGLSSLQHQSQAHSSAFNQTQGSSISQQFGQNKNSLNKSFRKKEVVKVVIENQALLKRIQASRSQYSVRAWEKNRSQNEQYISRISEYQYKDFKPNKTFFKVGFYKDHSEFPHSPQSISNQITYSSIVCLTFRCNFTCFIYEKGSKRPNGKLQPLFKNQNISQIIFKNGKKIGSYIYLIEVKVSKGVFSINLENLQRQFNRYNIELSETEGMDILQNECNNDPEILLGRIRIDERTKSFFFDRSHSKQMRGPSPFDQNQGTFDSANPMNLNLDENKNVGQRNHSRVTEENEDENSVHISKSEKDNKLNVSLSKNNLKNNDFEMQQQQQSSMHSLKLETQKNQDQDQIQINHENKGKEDGEENSDKEYEGKDEFEEDEGHEEAQKEQEEQKQDEVIQKDQERKEEEKQEEEANNEYNQEEYEIED